MSRLCVRPGCSEVGAAEYGMVPEDLLFWISAVSTTPRDGSNVLCLRHADAMSVPRGWTLDDRREEVPRLFAPRRFTTEADHETRRRAGRRSRRTHPEVEQLQIDGTGPIPRPTLEASELDELERIAAPVDDGAPAGTVLEPAAPWRPEFDNDDDLDGLLEVSSPLLARAFRGTGRPPA